MLLVPGVHAEDPKTRKYSYSEIDMPVSLAIGSVRTPEFTVRHEAYFIMIQAEKRLPFRDMRCMMGLKDGTLSFEDCGKEPLLQTYWIVRDGNHIVSSGSSAPWGAAEFTDKYLCRFLGQFMGESKKTYTVEVKFTEDGTPLNVTNPHLIVILVRKH